MGWYTDWKRDCFLNHICFTNQITPLCLCYYRSAVVGRFAVFGAAFKLFCPANHPQQHKKRGIRVGNLHRSGHFGTKRSVSWSCTVQILESSSQWGASTPETPICYFVVGRLYFMSPFTNLVLRCSGLWFEETWGSRALMTFAVPYYLFTVAWAKFLQWWVDKCTM